ncbi:hypothetical protein H4R19_005631 [Coemansia spiralis]|nr:hypothetical protein H4R19_005631 [Coemansia spiralis]
MGGGEATGDCIWVNLMDRYLQCSGLVARDRPAAAHAPDSASGGGAHARPEVVATSQMNATTRLTFLNLLLVLQPYLRIVEPDMQRRVNAYYTEMVLSSKSDAALPVRKASLELSLALERM